VQASNVDEIIRRQASEATRLEAARPQMDALTANAMKYLRPLDQAR
jgi:ribose transport system substrate-binding protein